MAESVAQMAAGTPLLQTKLYVPNWRSGLVARPQLIERLEQGVERKLILVSAPPGFGKSTLLAEWLSANPTAERCTAWVSLDQSDNNPTLFWVYFITALQKALPGLGESALSLLNSPQPPQAEVVLTTLINDINAIENDIVIILDDYHVIEAQSIHTGVAFLLDHLPRQMHLVIASRSEPPLPLARLRGRGELVELGSTDLRFTPGEASEFLSQSMGLDLTPGDVEALENRTEGWVAGLQLAALSMQGRDDVTGFISAFTGDDRYIVDYLVEEVLQRQGERVRNFLLQTSILDRLSGPLCDAVTDQEDGRVMLESLERRNLFVVPLDASRQWYRYHHLFAEVLRAHLFDEQRDQVPVMHQRASEWYEQNRLMADAIRHALAAADFERAANLIELTWPVMDETFQFSTWLGWAKELPDEMVMTRPVLSVGYAWALLDSGEFEAAEPRLQDAERWLTMMEDIGARPDEMVVADEEQFSTLSASVATARAYGAMAFGNQEDAEKFAQQSLDLLPQDAHSRRGVAGALLGLAYWTYGNLEQAHRSLSESMTSFRRAEKFVFAISGAYGLAGISGERGRLREAISTYEQSLKLATEQGSPEIPGTTDLYLGLSEFHLERGDLSAAAQYMLKNDELGQKAALPDWPARNCVAHALASEAQGDLDGALKFLDEAESLYFRSPVPNVRPIRALKPRIWIAQGRLAEAVGWVDEQGLSANDELSYLREFEHITLARVLIARFRVDKQASSMQQTLALLERLLKAAEGGGRIGNVIEVLLLQALAHESQGDIPAGLAPLNRALTLAELEGYVHTFVNQGEPMRSLLRHAAAEGTVCSYTQKILSAFGTQDEPGETKANAGNSELAEPLTEREIGILRLIAAGLTNKEIADQLVVSISTIKTHINRTYRKLDVHSRTQAIVRIRQLGIA